MENDDPGVERGAIPQLQIEEPSDVSEEVTSWSSIRIGALICFMRSFQNSLYWGVLVAFWTMVDPTVSLGYIGFVGTLNNLIQCITTLLLGWSISCCCGGTKYRTVFAISTTISIAACFFFLLVPYSSIQPTTLLTISTILMGFPSGTVGVIRTFFNESATASDRDRVQALSTFSYTFASLIAPGILSLISFMDPSFTIFGFTIDIISSQIVVALIVNLINVFCVLKFFTHARIGSKDETSCNESLGERELDYFAVFLCLTTNGILQFLMSLIDAVSMVYFLTIYGWSKEQAINVGGIMSLFYGTVCSGLNVSAAWKSWNKGMDQRALIVVGLLCMGSFNLVMLLFSWNQATPNGIMACKYDWCHDVLHVHPFLFVAAYVILMGFGNSLVNIPLNPLYSAVLGSSEKAFHSGLYTAVNGAGKIATPFAAMWLFAKYGPWAIWLLAVAVSAVGLILWGILCRKMVPRAAT